MTKEADIYSAGIIIQEIMTRSGPFHTECAQMDMDGKELFQDWIRLLNMLILKQYFYLIDIY